MSVDRIGKVGYWFAGDSDVICTRDDGDVVTVVFFARDRGVHRGPVRIWGQVFDSLARLSSGAKAEGEGPSQEGEQG